MLDTYSFENIMDSTSNFIVIEGPDGSGKTTLINRLMEESKRYPLRVKVIRFPGNHGNARFRDILLSKELEECKPAQLFLFLSDFVYSYETYMKPFIHSLKTVFLIDRFMPSSCIYQNVDLDYINFVFNQRHKDMVNVLKDTEYVYLVPSDIDTHRARLQKKTGTEINHLDPKDDDEMIDNINKYKAFILAHKTHGLLGSNRVIEVSV